ncbi:MAG TPA: hypothetical protein VJH68_01820 [Candidatus Nanoarchaeia archaeon]|nr:hypothetical protein [Candidatus Nanoarchaeia archaeon]
MAKSSLTGLLLAAVVGCSSPERNNGLDEEQQIKESELVQLVEKPLRKSRFYDKDSINSFLNRNLGVVIAIQENVFDITYTNLPDVSVMTIDYPIAGVYDQRTESIYISSIADHFYGFRGALDHELGHFYTHQIAKRLAIECDSFIMGNTDREEIASFLISEGIAEYFSQTIHGESAANESSRPNDALHWNEREFYAGGYKLVKPILDLDVKTGIEYLLAHQPVNDLQDLPGYQIQAVKEVCKSLNLKNNK